MHFNTQDIALWSGQSNGIANINLSNKMPIDLNEACVGVSTTSALQRCYLCIGFKKYLNHFGYQLTSL